MNAGTLRTKLALGSILMLSLVALACGRKEEAPAASAPPGESAPASPAGATADEWAWADAPARGGAAPAGPGAGAPAAAAPEPGRDVAEPRPIAPPPAASAPKPKPRPSPPKEPVNAFEDAPYGDDKPAEPEAPAKVAYTAPAGAPLDARLDVPLDSATAEVGQQVTATLDRDLTDGAGNVVLPRGTRLSGTVTEVVSAKKVKKKSSLAYQLTSATLPDGTAVAIAAGQRLEGKGYTKKDAGIIGGSAAGGAVLGQILGGDTEATAAGAVIGGAIGTGVAMSKKGEDVRIEAGTIVPLTLERPVIVER